MHELDWIHLVARGHRSRPLADTIEEAAELWRRIGTVFRELRAAVLMPNHIHLLVRMRDADRLAGLLRGYARWRNHRRRQSGPVWARAAEVRPLGDQQLHLRRTQRYIALNPNRAGLVTCPLAWPWSTHRDAVGLTAAPLRAPVRSRELYHQSISSDPTASMVGTVFPAPRDCIPDRHDFLIVASELFRVPIRGLTDPIGPAELHAQRAAAGLARDWAEVSLRKAAEWLNTSPARVFRAPPTPASWRRAADCIAGDPRFPGLAGPVWDRRCR